MHSTMGTGGQRHLLALAAAPLLLVAGCSNSEVGVAEPEATSPGPASTVDAAPEREEIAVTVTFDGTACEHDAPTEVTPGNVLITMVNTSDAEAVAQLLRLGGSTFEQFVEFNQPEPKVTDPFGTPSGDASAAAGAEGKVRAVLTPGEYALSCLRFDGPPPPATWVAQPTGITVTAE